MTVRGPAWFFMLRVKNNKDAFKFQHHHYNNISYIYIYIWLAEQTWKQLVSSTEGVLRAPHMVKAQTQTGYITQHWSREKEGKRMSLPNVPCIQCSTIFQFSPETHKSIIHMTVCNWLSFIHWLVASDKFCACCFLCRIMFITSPASIVNTIRFIKGTVSQKVGVTISNGFQKKRDLSRQAKLKDLWCYWQFGYTV